MDQELTYKWIQERLRELNSGTLSEQDRLRLVEIANQDPFVADALEGFHAHPDSEHIQHLNALSEKIRKTKRQRRRWLIPNLTVTAIAASVLIIIATYAVIMRIDKQTQDNVFVFVAPDSLTVTDTSGNGIALKAAPAASSTTFDPQKSAIEDNAARSQTEMLRPNRDEGYSSLQMDADLIGKRITGRVMNTETGEPLPNAKLAVSYSNQLFHIDTEGKFELTIPESEAVIQVKYGGFADSTLVIKKGDENILVGLKPVALMPPMASEGAKSKGPVSSTRNLAMEAHLNINGYITSSSLLRLTSEPSSARRKVILEFKVKNDGRPTDITILETSRDKSYDSEAVRLIESSPDWVCPGGAYPCIRLYTFYFR